MRSPNFRPFGSRVENGFTVRKVSERDFNLTRSLQGNLGTPVKVISTASESFSFPNRKTALRYNGCRNLAGSVGSAAADARVSGGVRPNRITHFPHRTGKENVSPLMFNCGSAATRNQPRVIAESEDCGFPFALTFRTGPAWCPHKTRHARIRLSLPHENRSTSFWGVFLFFCSVFSF